MPDTRFRALGEGGPIVSTIGLGGNNFGRAGAATESQAGTDAVIDAAREAGVTLLDTAEIYGMESGLSETLIGVSLRGRRDEMVIATKFGFAGREMAGMPAAPRGSRTYIRAAVEGSLRRLQTDYIDLYQQHSPDPETPIEHTVAALEELVAEGKIRHYGHSNFSAEQIDAAAAAGGRFVSAQNEYNLLNREAETAVLPAVERHGLGFLPWYPLASGLLAGRFSRHSWPEDTRMARHRRDMLENAPWDGIEALEEFARSRGITVLDVSFGWLLSHPALSSVIAGATSPDQVRQNAAASSAWTPTPEEVERLAGFFPAA